jgi:hypothetical protein
MEEAKASWNTFYRDDHGFECQLTLRDEDEESLAERVAAITARILESGGEPVVRWVNNSPTREESSASTDAAQDEQPEKTYVDQRGVRRCNLKLKNGKRCGQPVTEREGRYGLFWSCPDYKEHAPPRAR